MAQSTPTVAARIEFHEELQRQLEGRAAALRSAREQAHGTLLRAERAVYAIDTELADVDRRARELDETLVGLRSYLDPRVMAAFPAEPLQMVFKWLAADVASRWDWQLDYELDATVLCLPYNLSRVCRRWRTEVLACPDLWTSIVIPLARSDLWIEKVYQHVSRCLRRSGQAPLDITCQWNEDEWSIVDRYDRIFNLLGAHANRWRRCCFELPKGAPAPAAAYDMIRRSTPLLEELRITWDAPTQEQSDAEEAELPYYLLHCPNLRVFLSHFCGVICTPPRPRMMSLRHLDLKADCCATVIWDMLTLVPNLERLGIGLEDEDKIPKEAPRSRLSLASLQILECYIFGAQCMDIWAPSIDMPKLRRLKMDMSGATGHAPLLERVKPSVQELELLDGDATLSAHHVSLLLANLPNLRTIHCGQWEAFSPTFFQELTSADVCPQLESFIIDATTPISRATAEAIVRFARSRAPAHLNDEVDVKPLRRFTIDVAKAVNAPVWLREQVAAVRVPRL